MTRYLFLVYPFATIAIFAFACSEASDGAPRLSAPAHETLPAGDEAGASNGPNDLSAQVEPPQFPLDAAVAEELVFNELSPSGEWVEILNVSSHAVDLSSYGVADIDRDTGAPKYEEAPPFPSGTILSPNAYVVVKGGGDAGSCPEGGWSYCLRAPWSISHKSGETLFLLDPAKTIHATLQYPPSAVTKGETWGRIPNGDPAANFRRCAPTPGEPNHE
jgi:hypothetical protein